MIKQVAVALAALASPIAVPIAFAGGSGGANGCSSLPGWSQLKNALTSAVAAESSGLNFDMWATIVDRDGIVCAVAFSGADRQTQWPGSRVISAQKANTANAFSLASPHNLALSTANLYAATQPGGSLFGLQESNPVDTSVAYGGSPSQYGEPGDPMVGQRIGGINVFGGGFGLYANAHGADTIVGGVGVSGDTSCADHMIGWRVRHLLGLDHLGTSINGVNNIVNHDATHPDNIIYDIPSGVPIGQIISPSGFGHPMCLNTADPSTLPPVQP